MPKRLNIIPNDLFNDFKKKVKPNPLTELETKLKEKLPVDYFKFYNSISTVYSSKIEGEEIDFDSFYKHKFLSVNYKADYTKKSDDLYKAYEFIQKNKLSKKNIFKVHKKITKHLLAKHQRATIRNNPMFVINEANRIEYVACDQYQVKKELANLFKDIKLLRKAKLTRSEVFYYAAFIHLIFVKIHPFQDGNGRTARLLEKWFLLEQLGKKATAIALEKNYFFHKNDYYNNIKKLGLDYEQLNYSKALDFLLMTINSLK